MRVAGFAGACCALLGAIFPSFLIIVIIAAFFPYLNPQNPYLLGAFSGVRACIAGLIMATALKMLKKTIHNTWEALLTVIALILLLGPVHPVYLILAAIPLGILYIFWIDKKRNVANKVQKEEVKS